MQAYSFNRLGIQQGKSTEGLRQTRERDQPGRTMRQSKNLEVLRRHALSTYALEPGIYACIQAFNCVLLYLYSLLVAGSLDYPVDVDAGDVDVLLRKGSHIHHLLHLHRDTQKRQDELSPPKCCLTVVIAMEIQREYHWKNHSTRK